MAIHKITIPIREAAVGRHPKWGPYRGRWQGAKPLDLPHPQGQQGPLNSHLQVGTTFVELIKRQGTYLGVVVGTNDSNEETYVPRITQLIPGSWAQRSDVLCVGDIIVGVNGMEAESLTREKLRQILDESDRLE